jgi:PAS domain-containing protein
MAVLVLHVHLVGGGRSAHIHVRPRLHASSVLFLGSLVAVGLIWVEWNRRSLSGDRLDPAWTSILFSICVLGLGIGAAQWRIWRSSNELYRRLAGVAVDFMPMGAIACAILAILFSLANDDLSGAARTTVVLAGSGVALVSVLRQSLLLVEFRRAQRPAEEARITAAAANPFGSRLVRHGYWAYDVSSGGGTWSNEAREIYGVADDVQPTFEDFIDCLDPRDRERVRGSFNAAISGRQTSYAAEFRVRHPRLGERSILDRGWIERDPGGRALHSRPRSTSPSLGRWKPISPRLDRLSWHPGSGASVWETNAPDQSRRVFRAMRPFGRELQSFDLAFPIRFMPTTASSPWPHFQDVESDAVMRGELRAWPERRVAMDPCRGRVTGRDKRHGYRISGVS